jgi:hypothetical protein
MRRLKSTGPNAANLAKERSMTSFRHSSRIPSIAALCPAIPVRTAVSSAPSDPAVEQYWRRRMP